MMKRLLSFAVLMGTIFGVTPAATLPQANKFVKPISDDVGTICTNSSTTSTQFLLKPCTAGTDTIADCTTGELLQLTESSGDRLKARCFSPGTSTFSYSAFKAYLDDSVSYSDGTITTENYRGVDIRGTALAINTATTGGSGSCTGASNLVSNPDFEGTTYNARTGEANPMPDHWALKSAASLFTATPALCHGGSACLRFNANTGDATTRAQQAAFIGNSPGGIFSCICDTGGTGPGVPSGTQSYILLNKNQTYTLTFWLQHTFTAGGGNIPGSLDFQVQLFASDTVNPYDNCTTTGCTPSYGPSTYGITGNSSTAGVTLTPTWTTTIGSATSLFKSVPDDSTYRQYTITIDTSGLSSLASDPFYVHLDLKGFDAQHNGHDFWLDDLAFCSPGVSVNASATTVRALTEDQLNFQPTVTRSGDSLTLGPFIGADITPTIAPSVVSGGTVTQSSAIGVQAGLPYTAPTGTYTLTTATSLKAKKPGFGTTKYAAEFQGDVLMSDTDGTASKLIFNEPSGSGSNFSSFESQAQAADARYQWPNARPSGSNQLLTSTNASPSVMSWASLATLGLVTGSGTDFFIPRWTGTTALTDSIIHQSNVSAEAFVAGEWKPNGSTFSLGGIAAPWLKTWSDELTSGDINGDGTYDNLVIATPNTTGTDTARMTITGNVNTTSTTTWANTSTLNLGGAAVTNTAAITPQTDNVSALGSQSQRYTTVNASNVDSFGTSLVLKTKNTGAASSDRLTITSGVTNATAAWSNVSKVFPTTDLGTDLGDATHRFGFLYGTGIASEATNMTFYTNNNAATETLRATLSQGAATATWTFAATNLAMGSGTITGVGTPISFEAGAIDPSVTAPSSGVIGLDRDTDGNQEIVDNATGVAFNPSDDGSSEWLQATLGQVSHAHTPATTGGSAYAITQNLPTGNYSGTMSGYRIDPTTGGSAGPNGACVGGSAAGTACSAHATCTGGGECRDNANSGNWNGLFFNTSATKGIWATFYPLNVAFNTIAAPYVNEAAAAYFGISLADTGHSDRVGGTSILFDDSLAAAAITTNLVYGVNVGAGSWGYGINGKPFVGLRVEDNSAASTNVKDVAGSHGISLLNGKKYAWGAALDTALGSADTWLIGDTDGTSRTIKAEGAIVVDSCGDTSSASTITVNSCNKVTITGSTTITTINHCNSTNNGRVLYLLCGTATSQITDGSNLKLVGNFTCATNGNLQLICDGTNWLEVSRSNPG